MKDLTNDKIHILVAEDDHLVRQILEELLTEAGYVVITACDGEQAQIYLQTSTPDLVLSDVRMPKQTGFDLLQWMRRSERLRWVPVVLLTAKAAMADMRMGMALGADDYVVKPFEPADLLKTIRLRQAHAQHFRQIVDGQNQFLTHTLPHELRTPLTGIIGYADLMVLTADDGVGLDLEATREYGRDLQRSGARLLEIVENFALWAQLESARLNSDAAKLMRPAPTDWSLLTNRMLAVADRYGRSGDLDLQILAEPSVQTSPVLVRVVAQLVDNALKFSLPGERVRVVGRFSGNNYTLSIKDAGRGMNADQFARIAAFRQFGRAKWEQQGMGLGLAIVQAFADISQAEFCIESNQGCKGITASISVPLTTLSESAECLGTPGSTDGEHQQASGPLAFEAQTPARGLDQ